MARASVSQQGGHDVATVVTLTGGASAQATNGSSVYSGWQAAEVSGNCDVYGEVKPDDWEVTLHRRKCRHRDSDADGTKHGRRIDPQRH